MDQETSAERGTYLESWKAIAAYLGRDVTTAQRWERSEGLPVHRLVHSKGGSVYGYSNEIDEWRKRRSRVPVAGARNGAESASPSVGEPLAGSASPPSTDQAAAPVEASVPATPAADVRRTTSRFTRPAWLGIAAVLALVTVATVTWLYGSRGGSAATAPKGEPLPAAAHEEYLRGRQLLNENRLTSIQESVQRFHAAQKIAPYYAPAYAGLASAHTDLATVAFSVMPPDDALPRALAAARRAVELDPTLAEGYSVLGRALVVQYSWAEAGQAYERALALSPADARTHMWYAEWLLSQHRVDEALEHSARGVALDPLSMRIAGERVMTLYLSRRFDEAERQGSAVLTVEPNHLMARWMRGATRVARGQFAEAIDDLERAAATSGRSAALTGWLAAAHARAGHREDALRLVGELEARKLREYLPATSLAVPYAALGEVDKVVACLDETFAHKGSGVHLIPGNPMYDVVRSDPRFAQVLAKVGLTP